MDTNADGKISRDEWIAKYGSDEGFNEYDLNGDGIIDADEWRLVKTKAAVAVMTSQACPIAYCANSARKGRQEYDREVCASNAP